MKYSKYIIATCTLFIFIGSLFPVNTKAADTETDPVEEEYFLFVREGCPHCEDVETFIEENEIGDYIGIYDIEADPKNAELYNSKFDEASVSIQDRGSVPVMFEGTAYYIGTDEIEYRLGQRFGIEVDIEPPDNQDKQKNPVVIIVIFSVALILSAGFIFLNRKNSK